MKLLEFYILKEIQNIINSYGIINDFCKDLIIREAVRKCGTVDGFQLFGAQALVNNYINMFNIYSYDQIMSYINNQLQSYIEKSSMEICIE
jgi:hypothetical protein